MKIIIFNDDDAIVTIIIVHLFLYLYICLQSGDRELRLGTLHKKIESERSRYVPSQLMNRNHK